MSAATSAVVLAGTVTLGASGSADDSATLLPVRTSAPFKKLTIIVQPIGTLDAEYTAEILFDGEQQSINTFPDPNDRVIALFHYSDIIFPPQISGNTIPAFVQGKTQLRHMPISLVLTNISTHTTTFSVVTTFEEFDSCRMTPVTYTV